MNGVLALALASARHSQRRLAASGERSHLALLAVPAAVAGMLLLHDRLRSGIERALELAGPALALDVTRAFLGHAWWAAFLIALLARWASGSTEVPLPVRVLPLSARQARLAWGAPLAASVLVLLALVAAVVRVAARPLLAVAPEGLPPLAVVLAWLLAAPLLGSSLARWLEALLRPLGLRPGARTRALLCALAVVGMLPLLARGGLPPALERLGSFVLAGGSARALAVALVALALAVGTLWLPLPPPEPGARLARGAWRLPRAPWAVEARVHLRLLTREPAGLTGALVCHALWNGLYLVPILLEPGLRAAFAPGTPDGELLIAAYSFSWGCFGIYSGGLEARAGRAFLAQPLSAIERVVGRWVSLLVFLLPHWIASMAALHLALGARSVAPGVGSGLALLVLTTAAAHHVGTVLPVEPRLGLSHDSLQAYLLTLACTAVPALCLRWMAERLVTSPLAVQTASILGLQALALAFVWLARSSLRKHGTA